MQRTTRIACQFDAADPFWVLVREAVYQHARENDVSIHPIDFGDAYTFSADAQYAVIEELRAQEVEVLVCQGLPDELMLRLLETGIPVIFLTESDLRHPQFTSPSGLYDIARVVVTHLAEHMAGKGRVLVLGGGVHGLGEDGRSRVAGALDALAAFPEITWHRQTTLWTSAAVRECLRAAAWPPGERFDAIFGLSDTIALAGREAALDMGLIDERALVVGINGDPLALAEIIEGRMLATVQTSTTDLGRQALDLARRAAEGKPLPAHFSYKPRLVTAQNASRIAAHKLVAMASLPSQLIGDTHHQAALRLAQLETSFEINKQVGTLLDRDRLLNAIAGLIRVNYRYDDVVAYLWDATSKRLVAIDPPTEGPPESARTMLETAVHSGQAVFVPDMRHSHRYQPDPAWPETRARVVVPIRLGEAVLGVLDLHSRQARQHGRQDLIGLQSLADQLGVAMRNAELYSEAVQARARAEQADQLKTRLLANVSHELRTPLNVILGYSSAALTEPNPYARELPAALRKDLEQVFASGEHLLRLINDLLDLSRAEIGELDLYPEPIDTPAFLSETLAALASGLTRNADVAWRMEIPERLPMIEADPLRLRQMLFNLLSNAHKFTRQGEIVLGAQVAPPHLHLWVRDTGTGIPLEVQERIFEPFVTSLGERRPAEGIGLGLTITRRLALLHNAALTLESRPGHGSTFHLYMPLPSLAGSKPRVPQTGDPTILIIAEPGHTPSEIAELARRNSWRTLWCQTPAGLEALLAEVQLAAVVWDMGRSAPGDWDLIERIRLVPQLSQLPFILYGQQASGRRRRREGMTNVLTKPVSRQALLDLILAVRPTPAAPVLIVDDDAQARQLYASVLEQHVPGNPVLTAEDGEQAVKILSAQTPALVILDLMMPNVDGFGVLDALRTRPATQRVPVIVLSGKALTVEDVQRLSQPRVVFQAKEVLSEAELAEALRRVLEGTEALPQPTSALVKRAIAYLQQRHTLALSRQELAATLGVSEDYLSHIFRQEVGLSPWEFLNRYRVQRAKELLRTTALPILEVAGRVGFSDLSYFNRVFRKHVGCTPGVYRTRSS